MFRQRHSYLDNNTKEYNIKYFHTISNILVVSLASSDFMLGIVVSPMEMVHHLLPEFILDGHCCLGHQVLMIFAPVVSICHLLLVKEPR
jgi:hypothetical protein